MSSQVIAVILGDSAGVAVSAGTLEALGGAIAGRPDPPISMTVTRVFGLLLVLVAIAVGVYLYAAQTRDEGPGASAVTTVESQAESAVAATNFAGVTAALQAWFVQNGTYAGATLPPGSGVVLVRGDASGYCLQTAAGTAVAHEVGPGGRPQPGAC